MSTTKGTWRRVVFWAAAGSLVMAGTASADVVSDQAAAILIFPKIQVDTDSQFGRRTDTIVQVTNTSPYLIGVRCYWVNANSHCSNYASGGTVPLVCKTNSDCNPTGVTGGVCQPGCAETDFRMTLTKRQPLSWRASDGLVADCPPELDPELCPDNRVPLSGGRVSGDGQSNEDTRVLGVQENPFFGELKCVQVDPVTEVPVWRNDLKGEATIISTSATGIPIDASKYNAIGIQSVRDQDDDPDSLILGGPDAEYNACPNVLLVDHFFDTGPGSQGVGTHNNGFGAPAVIAGVQTDLIFVSCTEDLLNQVWTDAALQLLVFNEFEQRFSTHTRTQCVKEIQLSDIDTRVGPADNATSIYNAAVQGTLNGQTRIRAVPGQDGANKVLAIAQERWGQTAMRNIQSIQPRLPGDVPLGDVILLSPRQ